MDPGFGDLPQFMTIAFAVFAVFFVLALAFIVTAFVRNRRVLRENGFDPMAADAQIAVRLARGPLGSPAPGLEQRLAELDDLHRRGVITTAEHEAARRTALGGR
jgi:hypothetical protein